MTQPLIPKKLKLNGSVKTYKTFKKQHQKIKMMSFSSEGTGIIAKAGGQEIPGVTGKIGLRVQNEAGQRLAKVNKILPREHTDHDKHPVPTTQQRTLHMDITRWSILKSD